MDFWVGHRGKKRQRDTGLSPPAMGQFQWECEEGKTNFYQIRTEITDYFLSGRLPPFLLIPA
jgi:hypothetical protein